MTFDQDERIVAAMENIAVSFAKIAESMAGINGAAVRAADKFCPERRAYKEPVVTRLPTEEDRTKESLTGKDGSLEDWLQIPAEDREFVGKYEREFLDREQAKSAGTKTAVESEPVVSSPEETTDQA